MSERKRRTEENIEDVERISNIMNRKMEKSNVNLGTPGKKDQKEFREDISNLGHFEKEKMKEKYKARERIRSETMLEIIKNKV